MDFIHYFISHLKKKEKKEIKWRKLIFIQVFHPFLIMKSLAISMHKFIKHKSIIKQSE